MKRSGQVDGFIVLYSKQQDSIVEFLEREEILYVLIGKATHRANETVYVDTDNILAGQDVTEYLYHLGHRKIAFLGYSDDLLFSADRKAGYQITASRYKLAFPDNYCIEADSALSDNCCASVRKLFDSQERPTAMIVCDDILAVGLERICREMNIRIPEDLSVISFNNSLFAKLASPQLTSVDINTCQLGIEAALQIINHIENPSLPATKTIVQHRIAERDSCRQI